MAETFFTARPQLAAELIAQGYDYKMTLNPWNPTIDSWVFPLCPELALEVMKYYKEIGKPAPYGVSRYVDRLTKHNKKE